MRVAAVELQDSIPHHYIVGGGYSPNVVARKIELTRADLSRCYVAELEREPGKSGLVSAHLLFVRTSAPLVVLAPDSNFAKSAVFLECVTKALKPIRLPEPDAPEGYTADARPVFVFSLKAPSADRQGK